LCWAAAAAAAGGVGAVGGLPAGAVLCAVVPDCVAVCGAATVLGLLCGVLRGVASAGWRVERKVTTGNTRHFGLAES